MPLTPQEKVFCDHLDYENATCPGDPNLPVPACTWMTAHGLAQADIWNTLMIRRRERNDVMGPLEPVECCAPAWKTAEEARMRNLELIEEAKEADPT
jgi:hypothetical protein